MKWLKSIGAFFVALLALFFAYKHARHRQAQGQAERRAKDLESNKVEEVLEAREARKEAAKHNDKANKALEKAEGRIEKLKEKGDEDIAERIAAFNKRMRDD